MRSSVELPCELQQQTCPIENLYVYWQRELHGQQALVAGVSQGKSITKEQHEAYRGRASLTLTNLSNGHFTLHLSDLLLKDSGTYVCNILCNEITYQQLLGNTIELHVTGKTLIIRICGAAAAPITAPNLQCHIGCRL